jgi:lysophospholipase L1-like esterase
VWKALQEHWPAVTVDYINAAVPGYTAQSDLLALQKRVARFKPDIIVIYEAPNDLNINSRKLALEQGVTYVQPERDLGWLMRHSQLAYLIAKNLEIRRQQRFSSAKSNKIKLDMERLNAEFRRDYAKLVDASQQIAKLVVTVTYSPRIRQEQTPEERVKAAVTSLYYMPYMTLDDLLTGFAHYNQVIREVAKAHGTLLVGNEDAIPADAQHYTDSAHFTDAGSVRMAQRVANAMIQSPAVQQLMTTGPSDLNQHPVQLKAGAK